MTNRLTVIMLLALALASAVPAPLADANAPPEARAVATPAIARLFEPVTFTDESTDPDGVIVRSVWTDTDGRDFEGRTVTRAFGYPGVHTITLTTTDDAGASATTEVQVEVLPTIMHGRAVAVDAGVASAADTGDVSTPHHTTTADAVGETRYGALRVAALDAELRTLENRAIARASVEYVYIPVPIGYILVTGLESETLATCDGTTRSAKFTQIRLNDAPIVRPGSVPPNTRLDLPGGTTLVLNAQDAPSPDRLAVTGLRVLVPGAPPVDVARAEAGVSHCPWAPA